MSDMLRKILEASQAASQMQQQQQRAAGGSDPIADMLGGILNGGAAAPSRQPVPQAGGLGVEDLIGMVIGGNASRGEPHHNGAADIISSLIGGGRGASSASINPIAQMLAKRLNIPPQIAQAIVAFFMAQMMKRFFGGQRQQQQPSGGYAPRGGMPRGGMPQQQQGSDNLDLDDLLGKNSSVVGEVNSPHAAIVGVGLTLD